MRLKDEQVIYGQALSLFFFSSSSFQRGDVYTFWHSAWFSLFFIFSTWQLQYFLALSLVFFSSSSFQLDDVYTFWHSAWFFSFSFFQLGDVYTFWHLAYFIYVFNFLITNQIERFA
jgi:hypothetical protein